MPPTILKSKNYAWFRILNKNAFLFCDNLKGQYHEMVVKMGLWSSILAKTKVHELFFKFQNWPF
jgi:hypothetical protein